MTFDPAKPEEYAKSFRRQQSERLKRHDDACSMQRITPVQTATGCSCRLLGVGRASSRSLGALERHRGRPICRRRSKTWQDSKPYILQPFEKRGEMDQGILRFTWYSLMLVAKGYTLAHR